MDSPERRTHVMRCHSVASHRMTTWQMNSHYSDITAFITNQVFVLLDILCYGNVCNIAVSCFLQRLIVVGYPGMACTLLILRSLREKDSGTNDEPKT